jgi:hypothetical protein
MTDSTAHVVMLHPAGQVAYGHVAPEESAYQAIGREIPGLSSQGMGRLRAWFRGGVGRPLGGDPAQDLRQVPRRGGRLSTPTGSGSPRPPTRIVAVPPVPPVPARAWPAETGGTGAGHRVGPVPTVGHGTVIQGRDVTLQLPARVISALSGLPGR